jgi:hypothetical protein
LYSQKHCNMSCFSFSSSSSNIMRHGWKACSELSKKFDAPHFARAEWLIFILGAIPRNSETAQCEPAKSDEWVHSTHRASVCAVSYWRFLLPASNLREFWWIN